MSIVEEEYEVSLLKLCLAKRNTTVGQYIVYKVPVPLIPPLTPRLFLYYASVSRATGSYHRYTAAKIIIILNDAKRKFIP